MEALTPDLLAEQIRQKMAQVNELYYRLVLLVSTNGTGKPAMLKAVAQQTGLHYINVSLELSRRMLDLTARQRALKAASLLGDIIAERDGEGLLLDHIELVFNPVLQQDPLRLLESLSRRKLIVAAWNGKLEGQYLIYAEPDHPEYRRYITKDLVILNLESLI